MVDHNSSILFLFPGQGAQFPGMGMDFFDRSLQVRELFALASDAVGKDMEKLLRNADGETLKRTDISQPAITLANLAASTFLRKEGLLPAACAGFSLGEYAALANASVISLKDCFTLVAARGAAMQKAADRLSAESVGAVPGTASVPGTSSAPGTASAPGMAAVLGLSPEQVESLLAEWTAAGLEGLYAANFNAPKQVVVAGTAAALAEAETRFKEAGARRVVRLSVAGPFHSPLVREAAQEFAPVLESISFSDPKFPLFSNVTGARVSSGAEAKALALRHMTEPVRWTTEEAALGAMAPTALLELGPGKVLQGLWKDSGSAVPCYSAGTIVDMDAALARILAVDKE